VEHVSATAGYGVPVAAALTAFAVAGTLLAFGSSNRSTDHRPHH